jgi:hypothetical protein
MKKWGLIIMLMILMAGCAHQNPPLFEKGVFVDFAKHQNDFLAADDILGKLRHNLEALVAKDKDEFKADLMEGHDTPGNMDYVENNYEYKILDMDVATYDPETRRITISFPVQVLIDNKVEDRRITYTFEPDKNGEWKIALID